MGATSKRLSGQMLGPVSTCENTDWTMASALHLENRLRLSYRARGTDLRRSRNVELLRYANVDNDAHDPENRCC